MGTAYLTDHDGRTNTVEVNESTESTPSFFTTEKSEDAKDGDQ